jgi:hypothetical protein
MIKKLIVVTMLIATLGVGIESVAYAHSPSGSPRKPLGNGWKGRHRTNHKGHRRHTNAASFTHVKQNHYRDAP